jgi:parvulin-like peptidyl-prolyl isomerase
MDVSEDGTVTGSIDVAALGDVDPKTDEAKAQHAALKAEAKAAEDLAKEQKAAAESEAKAAEQAKADEPKPDDKTPAKKAAPSHSSTDKG